MLAAPSFTIKMLDSDRIWQSRTLQNGLLFLRCAAWGEGDMGGKYLRWMAVFVIGLQVAGCYTDYGPIAAEPQPVLHPASVAARIQSGDLLKVVVYGEEALTGAYTVSPAGDIN